MRDHLTVDPDQVLRLSGPGPRYTSYPTVPVWTEAVGPEAAEVALRRAGEQAHAPLSIYVHLPFCRQLCLFCGCTVEITKNEDRVERYLEALIREIDLVAPRIGERRRVTQMHWGGGTPTHLDVAQIRRLYAAIARHFTLDEGAEVSIEVHPHVTTDEQIDTLLELGFHRISMGVQDTDAGVQAAVHRHQTVDETRRIVERSRRGGASGVNMDIMYGLPEQTEATWSATLDTIAELRPDRLAVYGYAHVPWLKPGQKALESHGLPDALQRAELFAIAVDRLGAAGYEALGLDHFALSTDALSESLRDGTMHRNFMGYTTQRASDMVAFGMSAIGDVGGAFLQNARSTADYEAQVQADVLPVVRGHVRSADDDLRRAVIQSLMCRMRLDLDELESEVGRSDLSSYFASEWSALAPLAAEGLCELTSRRVEVTSVGRLFLRHLAMVFDAYLERKPAGESRFSQTV